MNGMSVGVSDNKIVEMKGIVSLVGSGFNSQQAKTSWHRPLHRFGSGSVGCDHLETIWEMVHRVS